MICLHMFDKINSNLRAFNYFKFHLSFKMFQLFDFPPSCEATGWQERSGSRNVFNIFGSLSADHGTYFSW